MRTSKFTLYVDLEKSEQSNLVEVVERIARKKKGSEMKFSVLNIESSKEVKGEISDRGLYINLIKGDGEPTFKFKDEMMSLIGRLKDEINKTSVMTFNEMIPKTESDNELKVVSKNFIECVENNSDYYNK